MTYSVRALPKPPRIRVDADVTTVEEASKLRDHVNEQVDRVFPEIEHKQSIYRLRNACEEFRGEVLHGLEGFTSEQTNDVLDLFDAVIGFVLYEAEKEQADG